jgi:DNA modification methylase
MLMPLDEIICGDCKDVLEKFPDDCIDLIVTSPPYADSRKKTYGGIHPDDYVKWFLPRTEQFFRVLKPTGTFILNIKEKVIGGERHTYVIELIMEMRRQGWLWTEEFCWHKKNCYPGKWPNRFRDAWERCIQFNKRKKFNMNQEAVMVPVISESKKKRGKTMEYPVNVLHMATECRNRKHSAVFPITLPERFIKLFTKEGDLVLDPFAGSGTTGVASSRHNRRFVLIDSKPEYCQLAKKRIESEA